MKKKFLPSIIILLIINLSLFSQKADKDYYDMICSVSTDKGIYMFGENIEITIRLMNSGTDVVSIDFGSSCFFNYHIDNYYSFLDGAICLTVITTIDLNPGESYSQTFTHTPAQYTLGYGAHSITGNSQTNPVFFSDNILISVLEFIPGINLFTESFETYTPNQQLCGQNDTLWKPWSGAPGSTIDPYVKNTNPRTGNNSLLIEGLNDVVLLLGDRKSGRYLASFYIFVPEGFTAYYNLLSGFTGTLQPSINGQVFFDISGLGRIDAGTPNAAFFNYSYNEWNFVENIVDIESDSAWIRINGEDLAAWKWSKGTGATNQWTVHQWAGIDFYAWDDNGTPKYYVDDISFTMLETPACAEITPNGLHFFTPDSLTRSFTIENTGQSPFSFEINPVFYRIIYPCEKYLSNFKITGDKKLEINQPLSKQEQSDVVTFDIHNSPNFIDGGKESVFVHYDTENAGKLGFTTPSTHQIAVRYPYNILGEHMGRKLEAVHIFIPDLPANTSVTVCQEYYGNNVPGDTICYKSFAPVAGQWNTITIDSLYDIGGDDWWWQTDDAIWVIYTHTQITTGRSIGFDSGPSNPDGSWYLSGTTWKPFFTLFPNYCFNWNIRLELSGDPVWNWLEFENASGVVNPNSFQEISITAKTDSSMFYGTQLCFQTSDPSNPTVNKYVSRTICDSITIQLESGWNLISTVLNPLPSNAEIVFRDAIANNSLEIVTGFENQQGVIFDPDGPPFLNTLTNIHSEAGYWVKVNNDAEIEIFGYSDYYESGIFVTQPIVELTTGWNLVGCKYFGLATPEDAFENLIIDGVLQMVTSYNQGGLFFDPYGPPFLNTLNEIENGRGYWLKVSSDCYWYPWYPYPWWKEE